MTKIEPPTSDSLKLIPEQAAQRNRRILWFGILLVISLALIGLTLILTPEATPAFDTAVEFMNAAGRGDDATASGKLSPELLQFVEANCRDGSVSACVDDYTPPEWGNLIQAVFRRSIPDGENAWDVMVVSTYEQEQGFSGVCTYYHVIRTGDDEWKIDRWSGFIACDDSNAGLVAMRDNPDAPNRAP